MTLLLCSTKRVGGNSWGIRLHRTSRVGNIQKNTPILHPQHRSTIVSSFGPQQRLSGIRCYRGMDQRPKNLVSTSKGISKRSSYHALCSPAAVCLIGRTRESQSSPSSCQAVDNDSHHASNIQDTKSITSLDSSSSRWKQLCKKVVKGLRLFARVVKLMIALAPVAALYPVQRLMHKKVDPGTDAHDLFLAALEGDKNKALGWYYRLCLYSVEWSGAAVIKLMQWASSRPDLFGNDFCMAFSKLQDDTTPHAMKHTEEVLRKAYGDDWAKRIRLEPKVVGSGCIGQVYKGMVKNQDGEENQVAVKVMHPNVTDAIADDLDLLRLFVKVAQVLPFDLFANLRWLNPEGVIEEFADLLQLQLDLRTEAKNLERFHENFKNEKRVAFPRLIKDFEPHSQVLIETFCEGKPVLKFIKENSNDQKLLSEMCLIGIRTVCQMLFLDNFMHGDLHPGNVLINAKDRKFILLDAGIATEYSDTDHELIVNILSSFIRGDGRKAGRYMIDDSNMRASQEAMAVNESLYIDKIKKLTDRANSKEYFMEHLSVYLTYICEAAAKHHVMMNQKFVTVALSIKILEGMSLALDPTVEIWREANPVILRSELNRKWSKASKELVNLLGLNKFLPNST